MRVLYVCTGNICRSPTAERLTTAWADELQVDVTAEDAGERWPDVARVEFVLFGQAAAQAFDAVF